MWQQAAASVTALAEAIDQAGDAIKALSPVMDALAQRTPGASGAHMARSVFDPQSFTANVLSMYENFSSALRVAVDVCLQAAETQKQAPGTDADTSAGLAAMALVVEQLACLHRDAANLFVPEISNFKKFKAIVLTGQVPATTPRSFDSTLVQNPPRVAAPLVAPAVPAVVVPVVVPPAPAVQVVAPRPVSPSAKIAVPVITQSDSKSKTRGAKGIRSRRLDPAAMAPVVPTDPQVYGLLPLRVGHRGSVGKERRRLGDLAALINNGTLQKDCVTAMEGSGPASTLRAWLCVGTQAGWAAATEEASLGDKLATEMMLDPDIPWDADEQSGAACRVHPFGEGDSWVEHYCFVTVNGKRSAVYHHFVETDGCKFEAAVTFTAGTSPHEIAIRVTSTPVPEESDAIASFLQTLVDLVEGRCKAPSPHTPPKVDATEPDQDDDEEDDAPPPAAVLNSTARPPPPQPPMAQVPIAALTPTAAAPRAASPSPQPQTGGYTYSIEVPKQSGMSPTHTDAPAEHPERLTKHEEPGLMSKIIAAPMTIFSKSQQLALFERQFPEIGETVIETWNCAWRDGSGVLKQGILFLTKTYICFAASVMNAKFFVELRDIDNINKGTTAVLFDNAIAVRTLTGQDYTLVSFLTRDAAYEKIRATWLDA